MSDFDAYTDWLKIPADRRPPTHYDLLGLAPAEVDAERIYQSAMARMAIVRRYHLGENAAEALRLQAEISRALDCLRDPDQKRRYDEQLLSETIDRGVEPTVVYAPKEDGSKRPETDLQPPQATAPSGDFRAKKPPTDYIHLDPQPVPVPAEHSGAVWPWILLSVVGVGVVGGLMVMLVLSSNRKPLADNTAESVASANEASTPADDSSTAGTPGDASSAPGSSPNEVSSVADEGATNQDESTQGPAADETFTVVPPDAKEFGGHRYKFFQEQLSWKAARDRCQSYGGRLAIIDTMAENAFVAGLIETVAWQDAWIGATDEAEEGRWRGVDGEPLHFTNWCTQQPNNTNNEEHYALMSNRVVNGVSIAWRWCDQPNQVQNHQPGFVCEWEPKTETSTSVAGAMSDAALDQASNAEPAKSMDTPAAGEPSPAEQPTVVWGESIPLFNGKDLAQWYMPGPNRGTWRVQGGVLLGKGAGTRGQPAWLATRRRDLTDFRLRLEIVRPVRSQVVLRVRPEGGHRDGFDGYRVVLKTGTAKAGAISRSIGLPTASDGVGGTDLPLPDGPYVVEIEVSGGTFTSYVGGIKVAEYNDPQNYYPSGEIRIWCGFDAEIGFTRIELQERITQPPTP